MIKLTQGNLCLNAQAGDKTEAIRIGEGAIAGTARRPTASASKWSPASASRRSRLACRNAAKVRAL
ncbi:MAG: hypothetical protein V5B36_12070 [Candidatus Accumulibacter sp. UW25]